MLLNNCFPAQRQETLTVRADKVETLYPTVSAITDFLNFSFFVLLYI